MPNSAMPNSAECQTARNPEMREIPKCAKSRNAPNPKVREVPNGAPTADDERRTANGE
jgi:hypothetical protein